MSAFLVATACSSAAQLQPTSPTADTAAIRKALPQVLADFLPERGGQTERVDVRLRPGEGDWASNVAAALQELVPWTFGAPVAKQTDVVIEIGAFFLGPGTGPLGESSSRDTATVEVVFEACTPSLLPPQLNWSRNELVVVFVRRGGTFRHDETAARRIVDGRCAIDS